MWAPQESLWIAVPSTVLFAIHWMARATICATMRREEGESMSKYSVSSDGVVVDDSGALYSLCVYSDGEGFRPHDYRCSVAPSGLPSRDGGSGR